MPELQAGAAQSVAPAYHAYKLVRSRKFKEAVEAYDELLAETPDRPDLWVNRGVALQALYRLDDAVASFYTALQYRPDDVGAIINRGAVLGWRGRYVEALRDYDRAIELEPDNEAARLGRGVILSALGQYQAALADADHVLSLNTGAGGAHYNKALVLLSMGDYREGFREHEWRFGTDAILGRHRFKIPLWCGEKTDKRILVHAEQGLGDSIQFMRYLTLMRGLDVTVEVPKALVRLFEPMGFQVIMRDNPLPDFDLHCPMMSLAAVFGTTLETVPHKSGYLTAPEREVSAWRDRLAHLPGLKVGLSWSSGVRPEQPIAVAMQARKSIATAEIARLLDVPGVSFVSLQKDIPADGIPNGLFDAMPDVSDMVDTAAIIENLDLVITVDSAVAHLAAGLGKPTWVLNRYDICWRWLSGDVESPWYDSARIFRQSAPGRWDDVITQLKKELECFRNPVRHLSS